MPINKEGRSSKNKDSSPLVEPTGLQSDTIFVPRKLLEEYNQRNSGNLGNMGISTKVKARYDKKIEIKREYFDKIIKNDPIFKDAITEWDRKDQIVNQLVKEKAFIPDEKLTAYSLNKDHPRGGHKAIVFEKVLGYNSTNTEDLKLAILNNLENCIKFYKSTNEHGDLFETIIEITGPSGRTAEVIAGWIRKTGEDTFTLTVTLVRK